MIRFLRRRLWKTAASWRSLDCNRRDASGVKKRLSNLGAMAYQGDSTLVTQRLHQIKSLHDPIIEKHRN